MFTLYNLVSLPVKTMHDQHIFILPSTQFLAVSKDRLHYTLLSNIDACNVLSNDKLVCKLDAPLYSVSVKPVCEVKLLFQKTISKLCDTRLTVFKSEI